MASTGKFWVITGGVLALTGAMIVSKGLRGEFPGVKEVNCNEAARNQNKTILVVGSAMAGVFGTIAVLTAIKRAPLF